MNEKEPKDGGTPDPQLEALVHEMLRAQLELGENITATSQFLRFMLSLASENLGAMRTQLENIRDLADAIDDCDRAS